MGEVPVPYTVSDVPAAVPAQVDVGYYIGAWFGGFLPTIVFSAFTLTGGFFAGLWYAVAVLVFSALIGAIFLPETLGRALGAIE